MLKIRNSQLNDFKKVKSFGLLPNGEEVFCYNLSNKSGVEVEIINYGAVITSLKIPISKMKKVDVVLGFDSLDKYINSYNLPSAPYIGAIVGRYAGRINNATFVLNNKKVELTKNNGSHSLHGGKSGFSIAFWSVISLTESSITLEYVSQNNE